ncbi:MAG: alpha/beta hydrolase [Anaerolineae bacterium]|jgi:pimeloyl-ACP methyl ester carboxylesterase|nr:alpha/beta hydrolase [Anaerolineae bacterium]
MADAVYVQTHPVHHATAGDEGAPPIIMLHGWGASSELLKPLGDRLGKQGYRVYMPDLPGFGQTPPPPSAWGVADYMAFVLGYADALGVGRAHWFGHSFGGRISLMLGADAPDRVDHIVLADSAGIRPAQGATSAATTVLKGVKRGLGAVGLGGLAEKLAGRYRTAVGSSDYNAASGVMRETFLKVIDQDLQAWAARIQAPTLLLWGDQDQDTPLADGQRLEQLIPDAGLVVFSGAGHYSYLDRAADAAVIIKQFLG